MLSKGTTFIRKGHVWFNLTEATDKNRYVLCVNFTCLDDECIDDECQLENADYSWIEKGYPTTIAFSFAQTWDADKIENCLKSGHLRKPDNGDVPISTVDKVIKVAKTSNHLSPDKRALIP